MRGCFVVVGVGLLAIGAGCVAILVKIGGKSDGPGALVFYIGAAFGLVGGAIVLSSLREKP